jgi:hypothetical protein
LDSRVAIRLQIDNNVRQQALEDKLKLPVIISKAGTVYVLNPSGTDVQVLPRTYISKPKRLARFGIAQERKPAQKRYPETIRLFLWYPEVSLKSADKAIKRVSAGAGKPAGVHIIIETGANPAEWPRLQKFTSGIFDALIKSKVRAAMVIEGVFSRPDKRIMDWLTVRRIFTRFILGPALGYPADLKAGNARVLAAMSEYGLRIPVLFYWSGQSGIEVAGVLKKALRLNKLGGIGILPYFLSPRFDCQTGFDGVDLNDFSEVLSFLYADRRLSEFLEEPMSEIEQRLTGSVQSHFNDALITKSGDLFGFRRFPFAAGRLPAGKTQFEVAASGRCGRCAWKRICGGVDKTPAAFRRQHRIMAEAWCLNQKILMRRVIGECLEIREYLSKIKNNALRDAG